MNSVLIDNIAAFDANQDIKINFYFAGGNPSANKLKIYDNETNVLLYDKTIMTPDSFHLLQGHTLENNRDYNCTITVYDVNNNSVESRKELFTCFAGPVWRFDNLQDNQIINTSSLSLGLEYHQSQGDPLNDYRIVLSKTDYSDVRGSEVLYEELSSINIMGLENNTDYLVRAIGTTLHGMELDTGEVPFSVKYKTSYLDAPFELENKQQDGVVRIITNFMVLFGKPNYSNIHFLNIKSPPSKNGYAIDLRVDNHNLIFNDTNKIIRNYTAIFTGFGFTVDKPILDVTSLVPEDNITLMWKQVKEETKLYVYLELTAIDMVYRSNRLELPHIINSEITNWNDASSNAWNEISFYTWQEFFNKQMFHIWIRVNYGSYEINITTLGDAIVTGKKRIASKHQVKPFNDLYNGEHNFTLKNGAFDEFYVTTDASKPYRDIISSIHELNPTGIPNEWSDDTVFHAYFDESLSAGNFDLGMEANTFNAIRIRRRMEDEDKWIPLFEVNIKNEGKTVYFIDDYTPRSNATYEYAIIPMSGKEEGAYLSKSIQTFFPGIFIMESADSYFHTEIEAKIDPVEQNKPTNTVVTIANKHPFVIANGDVNYASGTASGVFVEIDENNCEIVFKKSWKHRKKLNNFLYNTKPKLLKSETGDMWLVAISSETITHTESGHPYKILTSFGWTEIGDCDDNRSLAKSGIINIEEYDEIDGNTMVEISSVNEQRIRQLELAIKAKADGLRLNGKRIQSTTEGVPIGNSVDLSPINDVTIELINS